MLGDDDNEMPKPNPADRSPSPAFMEVFRKNAGPDDAMPFDRFMELALYHKDVGYYTGARKRVGFGRDTDFFTASSTGALFGELVHAACCSLLKETSLSNYTFVEIGAEPDGCILSRARHTFGSTRTVRIGEPLGLSGKCVVFSNELFDAQPFQRFKFLDGAWRELGVKSLGTSLVECVLPAAEPPPRLPATSVQGYQIDLPLAAVRLAEQIAAQPWNGVFIAFDYGKTWRELLEAAPAGTARAYFRHQQSNDLLARPGEQDLTCHICWDWLSDALKAGGLAPPQLETQEVFLIRRAVDFMAVTVTSEAAQLSQRKLGLIQLLHHLGQKFQVLWGLRQ